MQLPILFFLVLFFLPGLLVAEGHVQKKSAHPLGKGIRIDLKSAFEKMERFYVEEHQPKEVEKAVQRFTAAVKEGKNSLASPLFLTLIDNEAYPPEGDGENMEEIFLKLSPREAHIACVEYTETRKRLRKPFLEAIAKKLKENSDPKVGAVGNAVEFSMAENLRAYDIALHRIRKEQLTRPLCFTCRAPLAYEGIDPGPNSESKGQPYDFYMAMNKNAQASLTEAKVLPPKDR